MLISFSTRTFSITGSLAVSKRHFDPDREYLPEVLSVFINPNLLYHGMYLRTYLFLIYFLLTKTFR